MAPDARHQLWRLGRLVFAWALTAAVAWWVWDLLQVERDVDDGTGDDTLPIAGLVWLVVVGAGFALSIAGDVLAERSRRRTGTPAH